MELSKYKLSWTDAVKNNSSKNLIIAVLIVTNFVVVFGWFRSKETIVLVPPTLDARVTVSATKASEGYKTAWAVHVAELLGNVTPGNADFIAEHVGSILAPDAYRTMKSSLAEQIKDIKEDSITVSFEPRQTSYEKETDKVFVYGEFRSVGPTGKPQVFMRTYEMQIAMRFGRPWITNYFPYTGQPRTIQALKTQGVAQVAQ
ncbi:MAG: TraE/TraK family type IV conjugative transfer system protein [Pseudomonadales bacterium]